MKLIKICSKQCDSCIQLDNFLKILNVDYKNIDIESPDGQHLIEEYDIHAIPTIVLIDNNNKLIDKRIGISNINELKSFINEAN